MDAGGFAVRGALRAAITMPLAFAIALVGFDSDEMALFASFGTMALLVFVEFSGPPRLRLRAYAGLGVAGAVLVAVGTLCSQSTWAAVAVMALVAFAVVLAAVLSGYAAAAQSGAILAFVLAVMVPADAADIPIRLAGWGLAAAFSTAAALLLWPRRPHSDVRAAGADAARALADLTSATSAAGGDRVGALATAAWNAIAELRRRFVSLPNRPSGNGLQTTALGRVLEDAGWLWSFAARPVATAELDPELARLRETVERDVPIVLRGIEDRLRRNEASRGADAGKLRAADAEFGRALRERVAKLDPGLDEAGAAAALSEVYRLRQLAIGTLALDEDSAVACSDGRLDDPLTATLSWSRRARQVLRAHLEPRSVQLHNALRAAVGLALAVLVAQVSEVEHGFWVVLGTLSVLRSRALATGSSMAFALLGTFAGVIAGSIVIELLDGSEALLWIALPPVTFLAAYAPKAVSFGAGQAAFSMLVLVLFNLIDPVGYTVGLTRIEDVAIGAAVSLLTGLVIWPRGATAALRRTLAAAYRDSSAYLDATVRGLLGRPEGEEARQAFASVQLLDSSLRGYLSETSLSGGHVEDVARLTAGAFRVRRVARLLHDGRQLGDVEPVVDPPAGVASEAESLAVEAESRCAWYADLGATIERRDDPPEPEAGAENGAPAITAVALDRSAGSGGGVPAGIAIAWARLHLGVLLELEPRLAHAAARLAASR